MRNKELDVQLADAAQKVVDSRVADFQSDIEVLVAYLQMKTRHRDWHAVSDAAVDIRELEARVKELQ